MTIAIYPGESLPFKDLFYVFERQNNREISGGVEVEIDIIWSATQMVAKPFAKTGRSLESVTPPTSPMQVAVTRAWAIL